MAAEKTRSELIDAVLEALGVAAAGQPSAPEDVDVVDSHIDSVLASLAGQEIVYVADPDAVALSVFEHVAVLIADRLKSKFGLLQLPNNDPSLDEKALKRINSGRPSGAVLAVDYF